MLLPAFYKFALKDVFSSENVLSWQLALSKARLSEFDTLTVPVTTDANYTLYTANLFGTPTGYANRVIIMSYEAGAGQSWKAYKEYLDAAPVWTNSGVETWPRAQTMLMNALATKDGGGAIWTVQAAVSVDFSLQPGEKVLLADERIEFELFAGIK